MSALQRGIELFNAGRFWHAHEAWEELWLAAAGDEKQFLQGLIQLAAAYHHVSRGTGTPGGAVRLFDASLRRLAPFPEGWDGVHRGEAVRVAARHRDMLERGERVAPGELPKLRYNEASSRRPRPHDSEG